MDHKSAPTTPVPPWQSEFSLDAGTVRTLLHSQFPSLSLTSLRYLGEGWDSAAYLVNDEWIFRFPKRQERQEWLESELSVLRLLGTQQLELSIPVPVYLGKPSQRFPCGFMGYRLIGGTQGDRVDLEWVDRNENARRLGVFLSALHSITLQEAAVRGILRYESPMEEVLAETVAMREMLWPQLPPELKDMSQPFLEGTYALTKMSPARSCLSHGDLHDEHILLDNAGCVSGVIDWGDSCVTDPAIDFSGLYAWLGETFVRDVLDHYTHSWDASFLEQIAFRARCAALSSYGHSLSGRGTSTANRLRMVWTAFGVSTT